MADNNKTDFAVEDVRSMLVKVSDLSIKHELCYACREPIESIVIASDTPVGQKVFCCIECWSLWCSINCAINIDMREAAREKKACIHI